MMRRMLDAVGKATHRQMRLVKSPGLQSSIVPSSFQEIGGCRL